MCPSGKGGTESNENGPVGGAPSPLPPDGGASQGDGASGEACLDLNRVTHRKGETGGEEPCADCPNGIEFAVDWWDGATGELVDSGIKVLPCGRKGCEVCGPKLRDQYVAHFASIFGDLASEHDVWFLTLTVDPKVMPEDTDSTTARKYLTHCWDKWMKRLRRRSGFLQYVGTYEPHKRNGQWHMHVVLCGDFPECPTEAEARDMMRVQWFEAGGGAVAKVKQVRPGVERKSRDGTPDGVAGSVGYVMKYTFKDAAEASEECRSRRSLLASQGIGYHSEEAKERRREHVAASAGGDSNGVVRDWTPMASGGGFEGYEDTLTEEDRSRFNRWDKSRRTLTYKEREEASDEFGGRTVWIVWEMDTEAGRLRRTVYDGYPDNRSSSIIEQAR